MNERLRQLIRIRMEDVGIQQKDLAERLSVSAGQVSRIISGERGTTLDNLIAIADILQIKRDYLLRVAAGLPDNPDTDPWVEDMSEQLAHIAIDSRSYIQDLVRGIIKRQKGNGNSKSKKLVKNER